MKRAVLWGVAISLAIGCKHEEPRPPMVGAYVPPPLAKADLVMGASTEQELLAKLPGAKLVKDTSLGGTQIVQLDSKPAIDAEFNDMQFWLVGTPPVLAQATFHEDGLCDWVEKTLVPLKAPTFCGRSNRRVDTGTIEMCLATKGGAPISLVCEKSCALVGGARSQCMTLRVH